MRPGTSFLPDHRQTPDSSRRGHVIRCDVLAQIARTSQTTFATLARSELIHIPTRLLDGETLSEEPAAAAAKLTGARKILAPNARVRQTAQLYEAVGSAAGHVATYVAPGARATEFDPPALFRPAEFQGRP